MNDSLDPELNPDEASSGEAARALLAAHALGVTEAAEAVAVRRLVERDTSAAAELASYEALAGALLFAAPPVAPPPALEARLRAQLSAPRALAPLARESWPTRLARWLSPPTWPAWGVAFAALALLVISNLWWGGNLRQVREQEALAAATMTATERDKAAMMALMMSDTMQKTQLPAAEAGSAAGAWANLYWDPAQPVALLHAGDLPPLGEEQVYQLWLVRGEERASGGLFTVDAAGNATLMVQSAEPLAGFDAVGITPEPLGGSPGPTAPPVVAGGL